MVPISSGRVQKGLYKRSWLQQNGTKGKESKGRIKVKCGKTQTILGCEFGFHGYFFLRGEKYQESVASKRVRCSREEALCMYEKMKGGLEAC